MLKYENLWSFLEIGIKQDFIHLWPHTKVQKIVANLQGHCFYFEGCFHCTCSFFDGNYSNNINYMNIEYDMITLNVYSDAYILNHIKQFESINLLSHSNAYILNYTKQFELINLLSLVHEYKIKFKNFF